MITAAAAVRAAARRLEAAGAPAEQAMVDAGVLLRGLLGWSLADWLLHQERPLDQAQFDHFDRLVARRTTSEPVAYLLGEREFYGRTFRVSDAVLIPRPETEMLVDRAMAWLRNRGPAQVVDVGTGSGCIAVTLALECPQIEMQATDVSAAALALAQENATRLGARVRWHHTNLLDQVEAPLDLIVSNPPYVPEGDRAELMRDVRDFEPAAALFGGGDGLDVIRQLIPLAWARLVPGGGLMMEVGAGQRAAVTSLLAESSFRDVTWWPDLQGIDRVVTCTRAL